jgi:hypothetical protein
MHRIQKALAIYAISLVYLISIGLGMSNASATEVPFNQQMIAHGGGHGGHHSGHHHSHHHDHHNHHHDNHGLHNWYWH